MTAPVASSTALASTCTAQGATSLSASTFQPTGTPGLTSTGARNFYAALRPLVTYSNSFIVGYTPLNSTSSTAVLPINPYDGSPASSPAQAALNTQLTNEGFTGLVSLLNGGLNGLSGYCQLPSLSSIRYTPQAPAVMPVLDTSCDDILNDLSATGSQGNASNAYSICGNTSTADRAAAVACVFSNCYSPTIAPYVPSWLREYNFAYAWNLSFPSITGPVQSGANGVLSCVNCGFSISNLTIQVCRGAYSLLRFDYFEDQTKGN